MSWDLQRVMLGFAVGPAIASAGGSIRTVTFYFPVLTLDLQHRTNRVVWYELEDGTVSAEAPEEELHEARKRRIAEASGLEIGRAIGQSIGRYVDETFLKAELEQAMKVPDKPIGPNE